MIENENHAPPNVGDPAPDFTLPSTSGENVTLSMLHGRKPVLLAFFPLAFTSVCTLELRCFEEDYDAFSQHGVEVLPISVDSLPSLKVFKNQLQTRTDMLSDFKREASSAYGVLLADKFYANRAYFLIDRKGIVRWAHVEEHPGRRRENSELFEVIARLWSSM